MEHPETSALARRAGLATCAGLLASCQASPENTVQVEVVPPNPCIVAEELLALETTHAAPASAPALAPIDYRYRLGAGDEFVLDVWQVPELSGSYRLGPDGVFSLPLLGPVELGGDTREEAAAKLTELVARQYLDPRVSVIVTEYNNNNVYVLGEVESPGAYKLEGQPTLLQVLSLAGGTLDDADETECLITRGDRALFRINLYELLRGGNLALNITLEPDDTVYVPDNSEKLVTVMGEVHNPGMVPVGHKLDLLEALTRAGSMTEDAVATEVRLVRRDGEQVRVLTIDMTRVYRDGWLSANLPLQAGDIVYVPEKGIAKVNYVLRQLSPTFSTLFVVDELANISSK